jgi:hypothetical protein
MTATNWQAIVIGNTTPAERLVGAIESAQVVIVVDQAMSPIRMLRARHLSDDLAQGLTADDWWTRYADPLHRELITTQGGTPLERVRFDMGVVNRAGGQYTVQAVEAGPFDGILAGDEARVTLYLECDQYKHPNFVLTYEPGMLCLDTTEAEHPIRDAD